MLTLNSDGMNAQKACLNTWRDQYFVSARTVSIRKGEIVLRFIVTELCHSKFILIAINPRMQKDKR